MFHIYNLLGEWKDGAMPPFKDKREGALETSITNNQWTIVYTWAHKSLFTTRMQETNFKLLMFWYCTPDLLHAINANILAECWRCGTCPILETLWSNIHVLITQIIQITGLWLPWKPSMYLLQMDIGATNKNTS